MMSSSIQSLARRTVAMLIAAHDEKHDAFPEVILAGLQSTAGASPAALQRLDDYMHQFFAFSLPRNFFIQMAVAGAFIGILVIIGAATIVSRIMQKSFWLFKATRRYEGVYIVPNALNTFLIFEGVFAFVWLTFIIVQWKAYDLQIDAMQQHIAVLNLIVWWPLWIGAFMAAWGSFYTAPGALDKGPLRSHSLSKYLAKPQVINSICFGTPVILIVSLIPLIVLAQQHLNAALDVYKIFHADIQAVILAGAMATPQQAQQFLARADAIWDMQVDTGYYMGIGYAIWPIWAGLFLVLYLPAGGYLIYLVWNQVRRQKAMIESLRQQYAEQEAKERSDAAAGRPSRRSVKDSSRQYSDDGVAMRQIITIGENRTETNAADGSLPDVSSSLLFRPLTSSQVEADANAARVAHPVQSPAPAVRSDSNDSERNSNKFGSTSETVEEKEVFFPALRPEFRRRMAAAARVPRRTTGSASTTGSPYARYKYLRRCLINLTILYVAIVLGASLYLGVSASLGRWLHESYMRGPEHVTHIVYVCCVVTAWGAVVFGSLCILAILARLIDPANSPSPAGSKSAGGDAEKRAGSALARRIGANGGVASGPSSASPTSMLRKTGWGSGVDNVRSLPAVPESVGASMDELMTGVSLPTSSYQPHRQTSSRQIFDELASSGSVVPRRMSSLEYIASQTDSGSALSPRRKARSEKRRTLRFALNDRPGTELMFDPTSTTTSMASYGLPDAITVVRGEPQDEASYEDEEEYMSSAAQEGSPRRIPTVSRLKKLGRMAGGSTEQLGERFASMPTSSDAPSPSTPLAFALTEDEFPERTFAPVLTVSNNGAFNTNILEGQVQSNPSSMDSPPALSMTTSSSGERSSPNMPASPLSPVTPTTSSSLSPPARPPRAASRQQQGGFNALFAGLPTDGAAEDKATYGSFGPGVHVPTSFSQHRGYLDAYVLDSTHRRTAPTALKPTTEVISAPNTATFGPWSVTQTPAGGADDDEATDVISPVRMTRTAGLQSSKALHPPPVCRPPSPPMSARSAMSDVVKPARMHLLVERQPVPSPTQAWTPVGQSGWHLVPPPMSDAVVPQDVDEEFDETEEEEEEGDADDATTFDDAHSSLGASECVHAGSAQRRLSVVPLPSMPTNDDGVVFSGITVDELERQQQRRASLQQAVFDSKTVVEFTRRRSSLLTTASVERNVPGGFF